MRGHRDQQEAAYTATLSVLGTLLAAVGYAAHGLGAGGWWKAVSVLGLLLLVAVLLRRALVWRRGVARAGRP